MKKCNSDAMFTSKSAEWETPQDFFDKLNSMYHFDLDACATAENAKCERYYTKEQDALMQEWSGRVWLNPPYGREIAQWLKKAYDETMRGGVELCCCLVPSRTDTAWWHDWAMRGEITFIRGRLRFNGSTENAPFPSALIVYRKPYSAM